MNGKFKYFEWNDAWVFVALFDYDDTFQPLDLSHIIALGDLVNHAIFTSNELSLGFKKLIINKLIEVKGESIRLTKIGVEIKDNIRNEKGGLFTIVDNTLKKLNSLQLKFNNHEQKLPIQLDFLNDDEINKGYKRYITSIS